MHNFRIFRTNASKLKRRGARSAYFSGSQPPQSQDFQDHCPAILGFSGSLPGHFRIFRIVARRSQDFQDHRPDDLTVCRITTLTRAAARRWSVARPMATQAGRVSPVTRRTRCPASPPCGGADQSRPPFPMCRRCQGAPLGTKFAVGDVHPPREQLGRGFPKASRNSPALWSCASLTDARR